MSPFVAGAPGRALRLVWHLKPEFELFENELAGCVEVSGLQLQNIDASDKIRGRELYVPHPGVAMAVNEHPRRFPRDVIQRNSDIAGCAQ